MLYSKLFGKTTRGAKKDIQAISHKLLHQAGFIRELSAGRYNFLPLGIRVQDKIIKIIDEEMHKICSQNMSIALLQPLEYWQKTNRDKAWGNELMKIKDRNQTDFALSATGEGIVTEMVSETKPSYKDLPIILHQFIMKFRDEKRPRSGLIRTREFIMKDAYSYHTNQEDFLKTYQDFYNAYLNIAKKLQIQPCYPVIADSGALGGDYCHEFQIPCKVGEDKIVKCTNCDYAANTEKAEFERKQVNKDEKLKDFTMVNLPTNVKTIEELKKYYKLSEEHFIKNVVYKNIKTNKIIIVTITGDLEVNLFKLAVALKVNKDDLEIANDEDLQSIGTKSGFVHSWSYEEFKDKIIFISDIGITQSKNLIGGYKTETTDPINVNYGRDFTSDIVADIAESYENAICTKCKKPLKLIQTIEYGHIFKYDHFYTQHHNGYFIDKDNTEKLMYMGAYGIGIGRAMSIIVELNNDEKGIIWPECISPYFVHLISLSKSETDQVYKTTEDLYNQLNQSNIEVLWDDRTDTSAGIKFNDADLIGIPYRIVISEKTLLKNEVEIKERTKNEIEMIKTTKLIKYLKDK